MPTSLPADVPRLEEAPLVLRGFGAADVPLIREVSSDPLIPLITTVPAEPDPEAARAFVARQHERLRQAEGYSFVIADLVTDEALGQIGLWLRDLPQGRASIGYWLASRHRGRGLARHALSMISTWGLNLPGMHRLELSIDPDNHNHEQLAEVLAGSDVRVMLAGHTHSPGGGALAGTPVWIAGATAYTGDVMAPGEVLRGIPGPTFARVDVGEQSAVATAIPVALTPPEAIYEFPLDKLLAWIRSEADMTGVSADQIATT